ncbi:hypothetical protein BCY86_02820 [Pajaroellobacter abortibovis]|uniref:Peptidase S54 rhomboid domain-containing protein n=2 Tax=Pajaroellobacter abortibovis TaxID=1882918 RepID=A0A1L6MW00_9BACT|nr:hypothetical protein BCY86_02820 [Pajaroellobacter abortibovis]
MDEQGFSDRLLCFFAGPPGWLEQAPVTRMLIWINIVVFAGELLKTHHWYALLSIPEDVLLTFGANYAVATIREYRVDTLISSCFVHGSLLHLVFNMFAFRDAGSLVERMIGSGWFALLYLFCGIVASVASCAWGWMTDVEWLSVGASGAICGVLGTTTVIAWKVQGWKGPLAQATLRWFVMMAIFGFVAAQSGVGVDNAAHAGGALAGVLVGSLWKRKVETYPMAYYFVGVSALVLVTVAAHVFALSRDPLSHMRMPERYLYAIQSLERGDCAGARRAADRVERLLHDPPFQSSSWKMIERRQKRTVRENLKSIEQLKEVIDGHCSSLLTRS